MPDDTMQVLEEDPWPNEWPGAVLPAEAIRAYSDRQQIPKPFPLIEPFDEDLLRAARYELRLGDEAHVGGASRRLNKDDPSLVLEPHQVAVVKTHEFLRIPRFLIARWNLRVVMVYEGLLWVGGPQVDPGWAGHLYCPVYNLAERKIYLEYKQPIFTMDFVRVHPTQTKRFNPRKRTINEHDVHRLQSAPFEELNRLLKLESRFYTAIGMMFAVLGIMVAALSVVVVGPTVNPGEPFLRGWPLTALVASVVAMCLSIASLVSIWYKRRL